MWKASVLIPAYNEEQNIAPLLRRIIDATSRSSLLDEIIVVASGCTDATVARAREIASGTLPIRVLEQPQREGKASAINLGLRASKNDVVVLISADVLPEPGAVAALLQPLVEDPSIAVVGGRPIPRNDESTFAGFATNLMWRLHHVVSSQSPGNPKCGEMIAFRKRVNGVAVIESIPLDSAVDEVSIQAQCVAEGYRSVYEPRAVVRNWGPDNVGDWLKQRRRINAGHILAARGGYQPATMQARQVVKALFADEAARERRLWMLGTVLLEITARALGYIDLARGQRHTVWRVASSTKRALNVESH